MKMPISKKIKLELNRQEVDSLLAILSAYNIFCIQNRNTRYMVTHLVGKFHIALAKAILNDTRIHKITITAAQAAAFDEAFVQTPILVQDYHLSAYDELLIDRIIYTINSQL